MRIHNRLFLLSLLAPACFAVSVEAQEHAHVDAQQPDLSAVKGGRWSDPSTWSGGAVPKAGEIVAIGEGLDVILDVSPPALHGMNLDGKLSFADDEDLELTTEWILMRGQLIAGNASNPHTRNATITLTNTVPDENINGMGDRGIMIVGGTLNLHGDRGNAWTKLSETAEAGTDRIEVLDASEWRVGDEIVLASTDFNPRQAERRHIAAIRGNRITLDQPLEYMHFGEITFGVDERGEVGLLTRNIKVQASADADDTYFGGHIMAMAGSKMNVSGIELTRMGQHLTLARYPIHWHLNGDATGQYIENSAIHDTYSRCITVHGTDNLRVENNVTYNTVGHCFFLEDGIETGNQFVRNLGIQTKCHPTLPCEPTNLTLAQQSTAGQQSPNILIPSDNTVSTFWITNPDNIYRDNVAAGSDQIGFWMAFPTHPTGAFEGTEISANTWPGRTNLREFSGNTAHSNFDALMLDRGPNAQGTFGIAGPNLIAYADPADSTSEVLVAHFEDFTAYKNANGAVWGRGEMHLYTGLKLADNAIGFTHASGSPRLAAFTSRVENSLFVGESDNIGNPRTPEEIAYGRSLPKPAAADFPIRGYEYYDYHHEVVDTTFVNYEPNDLRDAGALSYLLYTSFGMSTTNYVEGVTFVNAQPVSFPPVDDRWSSDDGGKAAYLSAAFHDRDGSIDGIPDSYVVLDNGISADEDSCEIKPSWNAAVCTGDMGRLSVGGGGGGGGFGGRRGGGAGPGAAAGRGGAAGPGAAAGPAAVAGRGGAPGAGAPGGRGGFGGGAGGAAQPPITLSRNGREFVYPGQATLGSGAEIRVVTARESLPLTLSEMDEGSWVIFELPGFTTSAGGAEQSSLAALRDASETSFFRDDEALWVKLVVADAGNPEGTGGIGDLGGRTSVTVSRPAPPAQ
jgi:cell migration-inducing and hyaluronan-binding protein